MRGLRRLEWRVQGIWERRVGVERSKEVGMGGLRKLGDLRRLG